MSFESSLIDTCDVQRYTETADAHGQPVKTYSTLHDDKPCRMSRATGVQLTIETKLVDVEYICFLSVIDVTEKDRIVWNGLYYEILFVNRLSDALGLHHLECSLRTLKAGSSLR